MNMSTEIKVLKKRLQIFNRISENIIRDIRDIGDKSIVLQIINAKISEIEFKISQLENQLKARLTCGETNYK